MFKRLYRSYRMAKDFTVKMEVMRVFSIDGETYRIPITEEQIGLLEFCAGHGINDMHELIEFIEPSRSKK